MPQSQGVRRDWPEMGRDRHDIRDHSWQDSTDSRVRTPTSRHQFPPAGSTGWRARPGTAKLCMGDACLIDGSEWTSTTGKVVLRLTAGKPIYITDRLAKADCQATRKLHLKNLHVLGTERWTWDGIRYELKRLRKRGDDKPDGAINAEVVIEDGRPDPRVGREGAPRLAQSRRPVSL